jgi:hypothetical protein
MQWTEEEATTEAERGSEPGIAPAVSRPTLESLRDFEHVGHESSRVLHPSTSILELNCEMTFGGSGLRREPKCVKQKAVTEPSCIAALASNRDRLVQETLDGLPSAGRSSARGGASARANFEGSLDASIRLLETAVSQKKKLQLLVSSDNKGDSS